MAAEQGKEIGKLKKVERLVNLNADRKRLWLGSIKKIDSEIMNESMPIPMNYFNKNEILNSNFNK